MGCACLCMGRLISSSDSNTFRCSSSIVVASLNIFLLFLPSFSRCEDFYKVIKEGKVPPHDVLLTNPPYSVCNLHEMFTYMYTASQLFANRKSSNVFCNHFQMHVL